MKKLLFGLVCFCAAWSAYSQGVITVIGEGDGKVGLNLSAFKAGSDAASKTFISVLKADLNRSGYFTLVESGGQFALSGASMGSDGRIQVDCVVYKLSDRSKLMSTRYGPVSSEEVRKLAHKVADDMVLKITGKPGMASARIAMVGTRSGRKELYIADVDGYGIRQLTNDRSIVVGPSWVPNGNGVVYTSYKLGYPNVFATGTSAPIAHYGGLNTGGAVSPDGKSMALILSKDGNPELYVKNLKSGELKRLTATRTGNEASPCWSPDGKSIAFVSDTSGSPKIYVIPTAGGEAFRLPTLGTECVAPDWGKNGLITFCARTGGSYQIAVVDPLKKTAPRQVSSGSGDWEDPSWAPDGRHIICSYTSSRRSSIYLLDTLKDSPVALISGSGDWYSPTCTP
ncbi:MAG: PD40 domain-containing protein [Pontiellaceae bacterium]|nr:PD40 domain-containing protein [Pontiellaceae bacterium]